MKHETTYLTGRDPGDETEYQEDSHRPADEDRCGGRNTITRFAEGDLCTEDGS